MCVGVLDWRNAKLKSRGDEFAVFIHVSRVVYHSGGAGIPPHPHLSLSFSFSLPGLEFHLRVRSLTVRVLFPFIFAG